MYGLLLRVCMLVIDPLIALMKWLLSSYLEAGDLKTLMRHENRQWRGKWNLRTGRNIRFRRKEILSD
jgi:hypothetical protein